MKTDQLLYDYPEALIATEPQKHFRCLWADPSGPQEMSKDQLFSQFSKGDTLVVNDTQVERRRVFSECGLEILFLTSVSEYEWEVLFPARKLKLGDKVSLPLGLEMELIEKGLPQKVRTSKPIDQEYFSQAGELALPPYIQAARGERHMRQEDLGWYQTDWAKESGSAAAPTASLHFDQSDFEHLRSQGVNVESLTLHVGLGTFLPIKSHSLDEHQMHYEPIWIPQQTMTAVKKTKEQGGRVWALGTTVTRSLEAWAQGHLESGMGRTDLFIKPGYDFKVVDGLLTNFHQPGSTLLALVMAFASRDQVLSNYNWAIENQFKLFSYGNLSAWLKN